MLAIGLKLLGVGRGFLSALSRLWRWLAADPARMAFAAAMALCGFLALRLSMVDGDRDEWRDKARAYEVASKAVEEADKKADTAGIATSAQTKGTVDARNERAKAAAAGSDDPLAAGFDSLRKENQPKGHEAAR